MLRWGEAGLAEVGKMTRLKVGWDIRIHCLTWCCYSPLTDDTAHTRAEVHSRAFAAVAASCIALLVSEYEAVAALLARALAEVLPHASLLTTHTKSPFFKHTQTPHLSVPPLSRGAGAVGPIIAQLCALCLLQPVF